MAGVIKWLLLFEIVADISLGMYVYYNDVTSFHDAVMKCKNRSMELAMPTTQQKYQELVNYVQTITLNNGGAWIGLKWNSSINSCQWLNGELLSTTDWDSRQPYHDDDCITLRDENFKWKVDRCSDVRPCICDNSDAAVPRFTDHSWGNFSSCIKTCGDGATHLSIVTTTSDREALKQFMENNTINTNIFLGINKTTDGEYQWMNGDPILQPDWETDEPSSTNCVVMADENFKWQINICNENQICVCENPGQDPQFQRHGNTNLDFTTCKQQCIDSNSRLPILSTVEDQRALKQFIIDNSINKDVYIGLSKTPMDGQFRWSTGEAADFYTWRNGSSCSTVSYYNIHQDGIQSSTSDSLPYICEITPVYSDGLFIMLNTVDTILTSPVQERDGITITQCAVLCYSHKQCYYFTFNLQHCKLYGNITYTPLANGISLWSKLTL